MDPKTKNQLMVGGAILAIALAVFFIFRTVSAPKETISTQPVPAKGIDAGRER